MERKRATVAHALVVVTGCVALAACDGSANGGGSSPLVDGGVGRDAGGGSSGFGAVDSGAGGRSPGTGGERPGGGAAGADSGPGASGGAGGASDVDSGAGDSRSCVGLPTNCGPSPGESCCESPLVTGGTFFRDYDGVSKNGLGDYTIKSDSGTVSDFRLDRYQITVGRFRKFVAAWNGGWRPTAGAGRHEHLNGGKGLLDVSGQNVHEKGWDPTYATSVTPSDAQLQCNVNHQTWTPTAGTNENLPIVCENWYEAYAFCIWDGGFLPSDMEVNYAASGGAEQRVYPWSSPPSSTLIDCTYANYSASCVPPTGQPNNVGSEFPKGSSKYGQADLSGNPAAWVLDVPAPPSSCNDCGFVVQDGSQRAVRGGQFDGDEVYALSSYTIPGLGGFAPLHRDYWIGARCARAP